MLPLMRNTLWLPLITPFKDGAVDYASYERLVAHYVALGVDALFPLGTTGESPTLDERESETLIERTLAIAGTVPVFVGVGGNATAKVVKSRDGWTLRTKDGSLASHHEHTLVITSGDPVILTGEAA